MGCNEHVERADDNASSFEVNANLAVMTGGLYIPGQDLEKIRKRLHSSTLRCRTGGAANPYLKLGNGDHRKHAVGSLWQRHCRHSPA